MKDDELTSLVIDLEKVKKNRLDESFLAMWGSWVTTLVKRMFGEGGFPVQVRGKQSDLNALAKVLGSEKKYMASFMKHGLNNPSVIRNRYGLEKAVQSFERETGVKWPLK
jgi:hypothetical protein